MDLNHARLPIPPLRHGYSQRPGNAAVRKNCRAILQSATVAGQTFV